MTQDPTAAKDGLIQIHYLGETPLDLSTSAPYSDWITSDWAMYFISLYGQIDGEHHKLWVLDQVARILCDTPIEAKIARWSDGQEDLRVTLGRPSPEYLVWREGKLDRDENGIPRYDYDEGVAP